MKAIMLMFDSLNKHMLSAYGCEDTITPNFDRLRQHATTFNNFYVGSMPCMPARRELHTGRYNFLHRSWSPLEPFDDSMPEILKKNGIHTHLVSDHKHYWRDGGATYHPRFSSYEFVRGQEGDNWKGVVNKPVINYESGEPDEIKQRRILSRTQHQINVNYMKEESDHHLYKTIGLGLEFIETNHADDNWFLQLECFDPHEPFFVPEKYLKMYGVEDTEFDGFPPYYFVTEDDSRKETIQKYYKALLTMVDEHVGKVLDHMDQFDLWKDTLLIVNTDHGFLLGEHDWWGKNIMPLYNEIANTPFFIAYPGVTQGGDTRDALAQTIDIPATILEYFGLSLPADMQGKSLLPAVKDDSKIRDHALFGYHGCHINITDGEHVYMRSPLVQGLNDLYEYTLMPTRINRRFTPAELKDVEMHPGFRFTKGCPVLKVPTESVMAKNGDRFGHRLYNVQRDPKQLDRLADTSDITLGLLTAMRDMLLDSDAPQELYPRYGLTADLSAAQLESETANHSSAVTVLDHLALPHSTQYGALAVLSFLESEDDSATIDSLMSHLSKDTSAQGLLAFVSQNIDKQFHPMLFYRIALEMRVN
uniref:sulfatase n=1 Tax=Thaumasiovibrio occultus TaxID=1891184 RepID=UPI000B35D173|nr:sulfatase [Thaumasiovibrio occultus]